jgi:hypothetical protein
MPAARRRDRIKVTVVALARWRPADQFTYARTDGCMLI